MFCLQKNKKISSTKLHMDSVFLYIYKDVSPNSKITMVCPQYLAILSHNLLVSDLIVFKIIIMKSIVVKANLIHPLEILPQ